MKKNFYMVAVVFSILFVAQVTAWTNPIKAAVAVRIAKRTALRPRTQFPYLERNVEAAVRRAAPNSPAVSAQIVSLPHFDCQVQEVGQKLCQRLGLIQNTLRYRDEILAGYHLPQNYVEGFFDRRIYPYLSRPTYLPGKEEDVLFRGMLVTPEELVEILKGGFSPKTSTWTAGADGAAVSFSSSPVEASHYIFQSGYKKDGIGVVFKVKKLPAMQLGQNKDLNSTRTIYYSYEDVPAGAILSVSVRGEYGQENLESVLQAAQEGKIKPHQRWTSQFDNFLR